MPDRTNSFTKPLLTVAALGATAAFLGIFTLARRANAGWASPRREASLFNAMARSALVSAAASVSSYLVGRLQRSLERDAVSPVGLPGADNAGVRSAELL